MRIDYHIHTELCRHAEGSMESYIQKAVEIGLDEIGFADHNPMPDGFDANHRMTMDEFPFYLSECRRLQKEFPQISIKIGLETDFIPGAEAIVQNIIRQHPFDYILGSIHFLGEWGFDNPVFFTKWQESSVDEIYKEYFRTLEMAIDSALYDIIAHPDLVKVFGHFPSFDLLPYYDRVCQKLQRQGMCLEVNTSGLRKAVREIYPAKAFLEKAFEYNVPLTLGSDAHVSRDVGADFHQAIEMIRQIGYQSITQFNNRRGIQVPLT